MPPGYRDWKWISVAHEAGNLNSIGATLGNDVMIKAYREKTLPFPDGSIIAALHYSYVPSDENNKVFGRAQSFVPGPPTNIQFMVKDSKKYAATGGWGFGHFNKDGTLGNEAFMKTCFPCHAQAKASDLGHLLAAPDFGKAAVRRGSRLSARALAGVVSGVSSAAAGMDVFVTARSRRSCYSRPHRRATTSSGFTGLAW
jgi:Cytochrome P460